MAVLRHNPGRRPAYTSYRSYRSYSYRIREVNQGGSTAGLRQDPAYAPARRQLAKTLLELHLADQAVAEFREAARLDPDDAESRCALMVLLRDQQRWDELLPVMDDLARMGSHVAALRMFPKL